MEASVLQVAAESVVQVVLVAAVEGQEEQQVAEALEILRQLLHPKVLMVEMVFHKVVVVQVVVVVVLLLLVQMQQSMFQAMVVLV
jgi:hypothetical protein